MLGVGVGVDFKAKICGLDFSTRGPGLGLATESEDMIDICGRCSVALSTALV